MSLPSRPRRLNLVNEQPGGRLNSWKDIAAYLDTSVRTAQRWERTEGLPVHRHKHARVDTVYAYRSEVDAWFVGRRKQVPQVEVRPQEPKAIPQDSSVPGRTASQQKRLIVLPFRLLRHDSELEFLSFGLADAITTSLSGLESLIVRSSLVAARYESNADLKRIADETGVDLILAGTLLHSGHALRLSAQLVEGRTGTVLWCHSAQGSLQDVFQLQDQIVRSIVESLVVPLSARDLKLLRHDVPANSTAYVHYLRANELAYDFDPTARDLYLKCVEEDPLFAPAWARLGRCCRIIAKFGGDPENFSRAEEALRRALKLNPDLALAHNQLAYLEADSGRAEGAMTRLLARARTHGTDAELFAGLVHVCRYCGLLEASLRAHQLAFSLDPTVRTSVCHTHFLLADYPRALESSKELLGFVGPLALLLLGRAKEAISLARELECTGTQLPLVRDAFSATRALAEGARAETLTLAEHGSGLIKHGPEELFQIAHHFAYFGEHERTLQLISRAVDEGFYCYPALLRDPWFKVLRASGEFEAIRQRALERHTKAVRAFVEAGGEQILGAAIR